MPSSVYQNECAHLSKALSRLKNSQAITSCITRISRVFLSSKERVLVPFSGISLCSLYFKLFHNIFSPLNCFSSSRSAVIEYVRPFRQNHTNRPAVCQSEDPASNHV